MRGSAEISCERRRNGAECSKTERKPQANNGEAKFAATIRQRMTLRGDVFISLADMKRLGEEKTYWI
jgi:hypothetical protein